MMIKKSVYYVKGKEKIGPLDITELKKLYSTMKIENQTLIWYEGLDEWMSLDKTELFKELVTVVPPPLPRSRKKSRLPFIAIICILITSLMLTGIIKSWKGQWPGLVGSKDQIETSVKDDVITNNSILTIGQISELSSSVVLIETFDSKGNPLATGSGFAINEKGYILTNFHVIEGAANIEVITDVDTRFLVKGIVAYDDIKDIAILKIDNVENLISLSLHKGAGVLIGDEVVAIGSPVGIKNTVSAGTVSGIREYLGMDVLQITAPISHGSSGGALFNMYGEVVGITSFGVDQGQNINFAIPISELDNLDLDSAPITLNEFSITLYGNVPKDLGNVMNGGYVAAGDSSTFFTCGDDGIINLYKIEEETDEIEVVDEGVFNGELQLVDNKIYYTITLGDEVKYIEKDIVTGNQQVFILNEDNNISTFHNQIRSDEFLYFTDGFFRGPIDLYRYNLVERKSELIKSDVWSFTIYNGKIYFLDYHDKGTASSQLSGGGIYSMNTDGTEVKLLYDIERTSDIIIYKDELFVSVNLSDDGYVHSYIFKGSIYGGSEMEKISDIEANYYNITQDGIIVFSSIEDDALYRMNTDGQNLKRLLDKYIIDINVAGNSVYFKIFDSDDYYSTINELYMIDLEGGEAELMNPLN